MKQFAFFFVLVCNCCAFYIYSTSQFKPVPFHICFHMWPVVAGLISTAPNYISSLDLRIY